MARVGTQEASVEVFGPFQGTTGCVVVGIEPMTTLLKGTEERVSKGVMPLPLIFFSAPGSAYWGFRAPSADWIVEASDRIVDIFLEQIPRYLSTVPAEKWGDAPPNLGKPEPSLHLTIVFDELQRRLGIS